MINERVFVTGIGVLSAIGSDLRSFSAALQEGRSGASVITAFDTETVAGRLGCEVHDFIPAKHFELNALRRMDRCSQLAMVAARQAVTAAALDVERLNPNRVGVSLGTTLGGMVNATRYYERLAHTDRTYASLLYDYPLYSAGARIVGEYGFSGPNLAFSTACSSANIAIGHAADLIRYGRQDIMLAGGVDTMSKITVAGFNALRNVTKDAIRPFDKNRNGLVLGEGVAILCLESESGMRRRGAQPLAEILGYGMSTDAYHMTAPDPTGRGPALAMIRALKRTGLVLEDIGYINAHGTGTRHNDEMETRAIKKVFGTLVDRIPVSSTKSMHGHVLGATGAIEAVSVIAGMLDRFVPPTINYVTPDPRCDLDYVPNQARSHAFKAALSNNFGFGGNNCTLAIGSA
ncbi:MAG: beta-ketoacyl-[acyl-carrier-protein] synthase family protein [Proteobacteria bacterium]|nr:beta-ketoacyl-[acyl-carrier-protein] synthase family protein [Desulfocapsa sp.]MBU4030519.1 beta-ketoacyl-[acyl-carrier-protein] synthase family protein [Pseudomonadota bacterium]MBU4044689.1 beta-ketoacyl-[acyl-carrier-protein] synthase family protein [Pseudomonadota bacterium]